jgi:hypothetical protein
MYFNETSGKVLIDKHLSIAFPVHNGLKHEMHYHHCSLTLLQNMPLGRSKKTRWA